jgi:hypothetical protein
MNTLPPWTPPTEAYLPPPPPTPPPPPQRSSGVKATVICGSILALTAFAGVMATTGSASTPTAATATTTTASSSTTTTMPMTTTTSLSQAMGAWGQRAMPALKDLTGDMTDAGEAADDADLAGLRSACSSMTSHIRAVRYHLPTPDPDMTAEVTAALDDFDISASSCISFLRTFNSSDGQRTVTYLESGSRHFKNATNLLDKY